MIDSLVAYAAVSLFVLVVMLLIRRLKSGLLIALVLPYLASTVAYIFVAKNDLLKEAVRADLVDYLGLIGIPLIAPYLVFWGPVISLVSVFCLWFLTRHKK